MTIIRYISIIINMSIEEMKPIPVMTCSTIEQIKAYANPTRIVLLNILAKEKRTVTSISKELDVHPANLTHHFKILEKAKLIRLVEKRDIGKNLEKYYRAAAINYIVNPDTNASLTKGAIALSILENDLNSAIRNISKNDNKTVIALLANIKLLPKDLDELINELQNVVDKYKKRNNKNGISYNINVSGYPHKIKSIADKSIIIKQQT